MEKILQNALSNYAHRMLNAQLYEQHVSMIYGGMRPPCFPFTSVGIENCLLFEKRFSFFPYWSKPLHDHLLCLPPFTSGGTLWIDQPAEGLTPESSVDDCEVRDCLGRPSPHITEKYLTTPKRKGEKWHLYA